MTTSIERIKVDISQLSLGLPLRYDLQTMQGNLLAPAGTEVTVALKKQWGLDGVRFAEAIVRRVEHPENSANDPNTAPHDPLMLERLEGTIVKASEFVLNSATRIAQGDAAGVAEVKSLVQELKSEIASDVATVLTAFARSFCVDLSDNDELLAQRSSQLSLLGLLLAHQLDYTDDDQHSTAMAGLFHDIVLLDCVRSGDSRLAKSNYGNHSTLSAALFDSTVGSNPKVSIAISQVHEQIDGTGFPKQLRLGRITPISRVLNVADAYLTLTSQNQPAFFPEARSFHPADAIGYLMYHAARGRFDRRVVRALIDIASLYPVGCRVELSDMSTAVVMRSSNDSPSKPIVRIERGTSPIIDLRLSQLSITRPTLSAMDHCHRLRKSHIAEVYWL